MKFVETELKDAWRVDIEAHSDERGFFARSFCRREFESRGLNPAVVQCNLSQNHLAGTIRGMHYQAAPSQEAKLVRCSSGAIYDVIVDLRPDSPSYLHWIGEELTASNRRALYVPEGFAHGFQALQDGSEVFYQMSEYYDPDSARGFRFDDPRFAISWPLEPTVISDNDRGLDVFQPESSRAGE
jgi:dTDP-4-dehydrorhamnose 3,5-epimerase